MTRADLHIHTVLSPCGDIEMTPQNIISRAIEEGLDIIGIADHNSTLNCLEIRRVGAEKSVYVLCGAEVTTREEVHVLCFVEPDKLGDLQFFLESNIIKVPNNPDVFGYQLAVNVNEEVLEEVDYLLVNALNKSIEEISEFVHSLDGIVIPAHIDKGSNSIYSQLGFLPFGMVAEALEVSQNADSSLMVAKDKSIRGFNFIKSSDAHYLYEIGRAYTIIHPEELSFEGIKSALLSVSNPPEYRVK
ncbi:MAG: PHP domain-containing protein [Bacteroidales bacterium]|nr:PHP domain-containing protein [Bacteroidales bacterium]